MTLPLILSAWIIAGLVLCIPIGRFCAGPQDSGDQRPDNDTAAASFPYRAGSPGDASSVRIAGGSPFHASTNSSGSRNDHVR